MAVAALGVPAAPSSGTKSAGGLTTIAFSSMGSGAASAAGTVVSIGGSIDMDGCDMTGNKAGMYHSGPGSLGATVSNGYFSGQQSLCIEIEYSDAPVLISNCEITNSGAGIQLAHLPDGAIRDCTITDNLGWRTVTIIGTSGSVRDCDFSGNTSNYEGGALYISSSTITVETCSFMNNSSAPGGGALACLSGNASIIDCTFAGNTSDGPGGAAFSSNTDVQYVNCQFISNQSLAHGGAVYGTLNPIHVFDCGFNYNSAAQGGAVHYEFGTFYTEGSTFIENSATYGGAISGYQSEMSILTSEIVGNDATQHGGIYLNQCDPSVVNICLLADNTATSRGSAVTAFACDPTISSCTIVGNGGAGSHAQVFFEGTCAPNVVLSLIAFGTDGPAVDTTSPESFTPIVNCCDIFDNAGGDWVGPLAGMDSINNNFSEDPLFCDVPGGDYTLADISPCYYPNNPCGSNVGAYGQGCTGPTAVPAGIPVAVALLPNHPNPFNPSTEIRFELPEATNVNLVIYDSAGRRLRTLLTEAAYEAGVHGVVWDGQDDSGRSLPSGIYFTRFEAGGENHGGKLTLLK